MTDDDFQDAPPPGGSPDIGDFQDAPPPGGTPVSTDTAPAGDFQDEPPPGGTLEQPQPPQQDQPKPQSPSFLNDISSGFVSGLGHGIGSALRGAAELNEAMGGNEAYRKRNNITAPIEELSPAYKAGQAIESGTDVASDWLGGDKTSFAGRLAEGVGGFAPAAAGAALTGGMLELPAIVSMVLGGAGAAGVMGAQGAASGADTSAAFNATPEQKAANIKASAGLAAATGFGQGALMMALGPLAAKVPGVLGYLASAVTEGAAFTSIAELQKAGQAYVDRATGVNPDAQYQTSGEDIGIEAATGALFGAGGRYLHGTPHAAPGKEVDPAQSAADQKAVETNSATSNPGSPSLGTAATAVPPDASNADPLKVGKSESGINPEGYHVGTGAFGTNGRKGAIEARQRGEALPEGYDETIDEEGGQTATHTATGGLRVLQPGEVTPEVSAALSAVTTAPEEKAPQFTAPPGEPTPLTMQQAGRVEPTVQENPSTPEPPPPPPPAPRQPPPVLPTPPNVPGPPPLERINYASAGAQRIRAPAPEQPVTPNRTQELIQRRIAAKQARDQQQATGAPETPRQEAAGALETPRGPEIAQAPEAAPGPSNEQRSPADGYRNILAQSDPAQHLTILDALAKDKSVGIDDLRPLAQEYTGANIDFKSRAQALKEMRNTAQDRAFEATKMQAVDKASRFAPEEPPVTSAKDRLAELAATRSPEALKAKARAIEADMANNPNSTVLRDAANRKVDKALGNLRTFTPEKQVTPEVTQAKAEEARTPRVLEDLSAQDERAAYDTMERHAREDAAGNGQPVENTTPQVRNQVENAATSDRHAVMDGRGNHVSNESTALKALDRTTSYTLADRVADERPFPEDINPADPKDRERLKQYAKEFTTDLGSRQVQAPDPRKGKAYQGKTLTMGWSEFKGMRPKDPNHATGQLLAQELQRIANKKGPVSPQDAAELLSRAAAIKAGQAGSVRQERSQQARETMQGRGQIKEAPADLETVPLESVTGEFAHEPTDEETTAHAEEHIPPTADEAAEAEEAKAQAIAEGRYGERQPGQVANTVIASTADKRAQQAELRKLRDRFNAEQDPVRKADLGRQMEEARLAAGGKASPAAEKLLPPEQGSRLSEAWEAFKKISKDLAENEEGALKLPAWTKKGASAIWNTLQTRWPGLVNTDHWARAMDEAWHPGTNPGRDFSQTVNKWGTAHGAMVDRFQKMMADPWLKFSKANPQEALKVQALLPNEIRARMWADLPALKRFQGRAAEKRMENVWKQQLHAQNEKDYAALSPAGKAMRAQIFNAVDDINRELSVRRANDVLERDGINSPGLADRITDNKYSPQDVATHGQEKLDNIREATNPHADGAPYLPFIREGDHLVMARRKIAAPTKGMTRDLSDPATGRIKYEFGTRGDAEDYARTLQHDAPASGYVVDKATGERTYSTTDPTTGTTTQHTLTSEDLKNDPASLEQRYAVTARGDGRAIVKNGDVHAPFDHVEAFQSRRDADAARDQMIKSGEFEDVIRRNKEYQEKGGGYPDLLNMMGKDGDKILSKNDYFQGMSEHQQTQMRDAMHQNMLAVQSGNRVVNPAMHRSGVAGFNKDLGRSMDAFTRKAATAATTLDHLRPAQEALKGMQQQARDAAEAANKARAAGDMDKADLEQQREDTITKGYNTMSPRIQAIMNHSITPAQAKWGPALHRILSWSSIKRLFHPMFWVQHAMQNALFSPVVLSAGAMEHNLKGGAAGARKYFREELMGAKTNLPRAMGAGFAEAGRNLVGEDTARPLSDMMRQKYTDPVHQQAFDDLRQMGAIPNKPIKSLALTEDETQRHGANLENVFGTSKYTPATVARVVSEKALDWSDNVRHVIEHVFEPTVNAVETHNRTTTAMAAFRQHYDTYGDYQKALNYASDRTTMSHANYQRTNKPAWMQKAQKGLAAPALQFKSFPAMGYDNLFKGLADMRTPGKRAAGLTLVSGLMATHAIAAGLAGVPFLEAIRLGMDAARMAGLSKYSMDDLWEQTLQGIQGLTGSKTAAQAVVHGIPNFAGVDLSPQLGEHGILFGSPADTGKERDLDNSLKQWGFSLATGATGDMFTDVFKAARNLDSGDPAAIMNAVPIRALNDVTKALEGYYEGKKNDKGQQIAPPYTAGQTAAKIAGFTLSSDSERGFAAHEASVARNRQADAATKAKDAWLTASTPDARSAAWKAAMAEGLKPKDLIQAKNQVIKSEFASKNINQIPVSRKTKPVVAPIANTLSGW